MKNYLLDMKNQQKKQMMIRKRKDFKRFKGGQKKMKYPLQKELEKDLQESARMVQRAMKSGNQEELEIANNYFNAITRINQLCVDRKRY